MKTSIDKFNLRISILILCSWIVIVLLSYLYNTGSLEKTFQDMALDSAKISYQKDVLYRRWVTMHGGVYVPQTDKTPSNPYLTQVPERDIVTKSGRKLTLINPAYMTRQVYEMELEQYDVKAHITSLNLIRPKNSPDKWEEKALHLFQDGIPEFSSMEVIDGQPYLRYMKPLITEQGCLKCHAAQGYKEGDIRGGISVAVPMSNYRSFKADSQSTILISHIVIFSIGTLLIIIFSTVISRKNREKIKIQQSLREALERFSLAVEGSTDGIWDWNIQTNDVYFSPRWKDILGYKDNEIKNDFLEWELLTHREDVEKSWEQLNEIIDGKSEQFHIEFRMKHKDGHWVEILSRASLMKDDQNKALRLVGTHTDLSLIRKAEQDALISEQKYKMLFENMKSGFVLNQVITDDKNVPTSYIIKEVNPAYEYVMGVKKENIINKNIRSIEPDIDEAWIKETGEVALTGKPMTKEVYIPGMDKYFSISVFSPKLGEFASVMEDVTERKRQQELIISSLEEKETLLKELYHRTKNNMQVISGLLRLQASYTDSNEVKQQLQDAESRIVSMALVHKKLYQSDNLASINLKDYISDLSSTIMMSRGYIDNDIKLNLYLEEIFTSIDTSIPLGLVLNELFSNIQKYAFPENTGIIGITLISLDSGKISLEVRDNGVGLPEGFDIRNSNSLGMQIIFNIVENQLSGEVDFVNDGGVRCLIKFKNVRE